MAVGRSVCVALSGIDGTIVHVEADVGRGLPGMHIGGLGDAAVAEARERVRTAAMNSGIGWPKTKIVVSMSPASLRKHGSVFDLSIVCAVLAAASKDNDMRDRLSRTVVFGEVGLDGQVRGVDGVLPAVLVARDAGYDTVIVPEANCAEAEMATGVEVGAVGNLQQLWKWAHTGEGLTAPTMISAPKCAEGTKIADMADIHGQEDARFALEVAAAGGHHMFLLGPPGTGKSMLATRLPGILPELTNDETLEVIAVRSVSGQPNTTVHTTLPPFIAPHHSATPAALLGGGAHPKPGALSLAHNGVLFLDEVSLMNPRTLDVLRTPLELGEVVLIRARQQVRYPCRMQLVMAANPCACGTADPGQCTCSATTRQRHLAPISGPLRDRIDMTIAVHPNHAVLATKPGEASATIRQRVCAARARATHRWNTLGIDGGQQWRTNSDVAGPALRRHAPATDSAMAYLEALLAAGAISQRGIDRSLRVAWTLADLAEKNQPGIAEVARAVDLHDNTQHMVAP